MKKLFLAIPVCLSLGGCITLSELGSGISLVSKSITNPVTPMEEVQLELGIDAAITALKGYKTACAQGTADKPCKANIAAIQQYTTQMPPLIAQLRGFVDTNNQINAVVVYNQLTALYTNFKTSASQLGYNVGKLP